ncbi:MAG: cysteine desulfurase family protein [Bdellovibrionales bacterium]|nr:cysteine desulfurase family protein [Bdellovibrionales bacterium]
MRVLLDKRRVYLDYNATTPPAEFLNRQIQEWLPLWGNPSSVHQNGQKARSLFWSAKVHLAKFIGCHPLELIATSGGSEANNMAIRGLYEKYFLQDSKRNEIIISAVEHPSVKSPIESLKAKGMKIRYIPVSMQGELDLSVYESTLSDKTFLASIMYANNETGNLFPVSRLVKMAHKVGAFFHCDAVQALGKIHFNLHKLGVDTASFSAHKFYSLKGTGVLYCRKGLLPDNLIRGGPQERNRRAGTENVLGMACFGAVAQRGEEILRQFQGIGKLRDKMEQHILSHIGGAKVLGQKGQRLYNTSCIYIPGVQGETLLMNMDLKGYSFSVGSACHSGSLNPSGVLIAMGLNEEEARSAIRISLGLGVFKEELDRFLSDLIDSIKRIQSFPQNQNFQNEL